MTNEPTPKITVTQQGRGGAILYAEAGVNITFGWEFGSGRTIVFIDVPDPIRWESNTKSALNRRDEILLTVAEQCILQKAPGCQFQIEDNYIEIFRKAKLEQ